MDPSKLRPPRYPFLLSHSYPSNGGNGLQFTQSTICARRCRPRVETLLNGREPWPLRAFIFAHNSRSLRSARTGDSTGLFSISSGLQFKGSLASVLTRGLFCKRMNYNEPGYILSIHSGLSFFREERHTFPPLGIVMYWI
jgi:hypothetical protein